MSDPDIYASEQVLAVVRRLTVPNIEQVARSAGLARVTAKKYLDELVAARTKEASQAGVPKPVLQTAKKARDQFMKDTEGMVDAIANAVGVNDST